LEAREQWDGRRSGEYPNIFFNGWTPSSNSNAVWIVDRAIVTLTLTFFLFAVMPRRRAPSTETLPSVLLTLLVLWLAGTDLRLTVLAVPPVLPLIHREFALSERAIGALSGLPPLLFGLAAIPGSLLIARLGARCAAIAALLLIAAASAARGIGPSVPMLFAMTGIMSVGVAIMQPALPTLVAGWFATRPGFAVWAVPVGATAGLLVLCPDGSAMAAPVSASPRPSTPALWWPDLRSRQTWQLGLMLGGTGGLYFASNAFIPDYLHAVGRPDLVTARLGALNLGQLPASLLPLAMSRRLGGKAVIVGMQLIGLLGVAALLAAAPWLGVIGAGAVGFCCAFTLIVTLALPPQLAAAADVHRLSAGMFAIGYTLTCLVPVVGGAIWDATGQPAAAFLAPAGSAAIVIAAALGFRFPGYAKGNNP
jgi:CP family cyanate transporter-like MFS transporter